jgi:hypothetical protein
MSARECRLPPLYRCRRPRRIRPLYATNRRALHPRPLRPHHHRPPLSQHPPRGPKRQRRQSAKSTGRKSRKLSQIAINGVVFDGQTLRIEFAVTRLDEVKANTPISGRRYPACRMVLPPTAAIDLINRMQQIAAALAQAGKVKAAPRKADAAATAKRAAAVTSATKRR